MFLLISYIQCSTLVSMSNTNKIGIFSILAFGIMMLLTPATSLANAQQYDPYYEDNEYYYEDDYYYPKDKKEKEPPMLLVKKDVLYCDLFNGIDQNCRENGNFVGPDSGRYGQDCTTNAGSEAEICSNINEEAFNIIITDDVEFPGSEEGTKLTFGERFTITEESIFELNPNPTNQEIINSACQESGFDDGFILNLEGAPVIICTLNEGECSDVIQDGELKECTVKNFVIADIPPPA